MLAPITLDRIQKDLRFNGKWVLVFVHVWDDKTPSRVSPLAAGSHEFVLSKKSEHPNDYIFFAGSENEKENVITETWVTQDV